VEFFGTHLEPIDISFGGLRIYSDQEYAVGTYVRLDVFFPRVAPVTVTAEVMWIRASAKRAPAPFEVGLAFVDLAPDSLDLLRPLLARGPDSVNPPGLSAQVASRTDSSAEFDEPVSEVRPTTPKPVTVLQGDGAHWMQTAIAVVVMDAEQLLTAQLDCRTGFLLSRIDGVTNVKGLLNLSSMPKEETLTLLERLRRLGIIELRRAPNES
jgi:hypothetical protein